MSVELTLCDAENLYAFEDHCEFVRFNCENPESSSRYFYELYFCGINENTSGFVILTTLFLLTAFYFLATTAEAYLSPSLSKISKKLNISETLAGVTLVAFANGAPDIISSFSAGESREGISLIIGSIFGGGLFVNSIVLAIVILASKAIKANKFSLIRDIGFYLLATLYLMILGIIGYVNLASAVGFLLIFPMYVVVVYFVEKHQPKEDKAQLGTPFLDNIDTTTNYQSMTDDPIIPNSNKSPSIEMNSQFIGAQKFLDTTVSDTIAKTDLVESQEAQEKDTKSTKASEQPIESREALLSAFEKEKRQRCWGCLSVLEKGLRVYEYPFNILRDLTIPAVEEEQWNKNFAVIHPFTSVWFFMLVTGYLFEDYEGIWIGFFILPLQAAMSFSVWKFTSKSHMPPFETLLTVGGLCLSIAWIYQIAVLVVELLEFIGFITQFHPTFLGMSLLAWGNSMGDLFGNRSLAKMGYGLMALTGCFAGSLFNLLIGFGSSMLRQVLKSDVNYVPFHVFSLADTSIEKGSLLVAGTLVAAFMGLSMTLTYAALNEFKFTRMYSICLFSFYAVTIMGATIYSLYLKEKYM